MLSLRRKELPKHGINESTIDIEYGSEAITLTLVKIVNDDSCEPVSIWNIRSTDWGSEQYYPKSIALTNNQPLAINDWLKIYGAKITDDEAKIHLKAPIQATINRRDRN